MSHSEISSAFGIQPNFAVIQPNNFQFKSLSAWAFNPASGCRHGCTFCYVPAVSQIRAEQHFEELELVPQEWIEEREHGKHWSDIHWGQYAFIREWDEVEFLKSLRRASKTPGHKLPPDGHRAVIFSSTTDPYQAFPDRELTQRLGNLVSGALELILEKSDLNVRILTRSPLARKDFDLYKQFGNRLMFGMSLPTLNDKLSQIYEPGAPGPAAKLRTLKAAKEAGLNVYVAMAPTLPDESDEELRNLLQTIAELKPLTIFHEPINLRADNAARIAAKAEEVGLKIKVETFENPATWREYAFERLLRVEQLARELNLPDGVLHSWPDADLGSASGYLAMKLMQYHRHSPRASKLPPAQLTAAREEWKDQVKPWIDYWHNPASRIASWPGVRDPTW